jgi:hypothetical protein
MALGNCINRHEPDIVAVERIACPRIAKACPDLKMRHSLGITVLVRNSKARGVSRHAALLLQFVEHFNKRGMATKHKINLAVGWHA